MENETDPPAPLENETDPLAQFGRDAIDLRWTLKDIAAERSYGQQATFGTANRAGPRRDAGRCPAPHHCRAEHDLEGLTAISIAVCGGLHGRGTGVISVRPSPSQRATRQNAPVSPTPRLQVWRHTFGRQRLETRFDRGLGGRRASRETFPAALFIALSF